MVMTNVQMIISIRVKAFSVNFMVKFHPNNVFFVVFRFIKRRLSLKNAITTTVINVSILCLLSRFLYHVTKDRLNHYLTTTEFVRKFVNNQQILIIKHLATRRTVCMILIRML